MPADKWFNFAKNARTLLSVTVLAAALFLPAGMSVAYAGSTYVEMGGGYETGDFGTPVDSSLFYVYSKAGYLSDMYEFNISAPYLFLENESGDARETENGFGDVVLRAGGNLAGRTDRGLSLYGSLSVKLPTADEGKGLGTGETDYGAFLTLNQRYADYQLWLTGGGIKVGDGDADYSDLLLYGAGVSRMFERSEIYVSLEGYTEVASQTDAPLGVNAGFFHILNPNLAIKGNVLVGLTEGESDYGVTLGLVRFFH